MHYRFTMIVPIRYNNNTRVPDLHWASLSDRILKTFDGYSVTEIWGRWKNDDGVVMADVSVEYSVLTEAPENWGGWRAIAEYVQKHWRQESVLVTGVSMQKVEFIGESDAEPMNHNC